MTNARNARTTREKAAELRAEAARQEARHRAVLIGGIFIIVMTGVAFTVGSLSNAWFATHGQPLTGRVVRIISEEKNHAVIQLMSKNEKGDWVDIEGKMAPVVLAEADPTLGNATVSGEQVPVVNGRSISIVYAGKADDIIPAYINKAMPKYFGLLFLLTLLAAAMSTLSSQFHALGTALGRDVVEQIWPSKAESGINRSMHITRIGIIIGIVMGKKIPERFVKWFAAIIFMLFGAVGLYQYLPKSLLTPPAIMVGLALIVLLTVLIARRNNAKA